MPQKELQVVNIINGAIKFCYLKYEMDKYSELFVEKDGVKTKLVGVDLYDCFTQFRIELELEGFLLKCNGGRFDTNPSGGLRDSSNGLLTYLLEMNKYPETILNVFDPSESNLGTIQQQKDYYKVWRNSLASLQPPS